MLKSPKCKCYLPREFDCMILKDPLKRTIQTTHLCLKVECTGPGGPSDTRWARGSPDGVLQLESSWCPLFLSVPLLGLEDAKAEGTLPHHGSGWGLHSATSEAPGWTCPENLLCSYGLPLLHTIPYQSLMKVLKKVILWNTNFKTDFNPGIKNGLVVNTLVYLYLHYTEVCRRKRKYQT